MRTANWSLRGGLAGHRRWWPAMRRMLEGKTAMTPNHTDKAGQPVACEVPLIKQLRSVPKDCRVCIETQWGEDGTPTGHRYIPVGRMIHEAADALTQAAPPDSLAV